MRMAMVVEEGLDGSLKSKSSKHFVSAAMAGRVLSVYGANSSCL